MVPWLFKERGKIVALDAPAKLLISDPDIIVDAAPRGLNDACRALIDAANEAGGNDNITALLVRVVEA